jgi:alpha-beta hydrolase superfamily lysophospholipase
MRRACLLSALLLSGCAVIPPRVESHLPPEGARGLVIVVDGAGGYQYAPYSIRQVVDERGLPLHVRSFDWTHGRGRWLCDQVDTAHARREGLRLAEEVASLRQHYPGRPVFLVSYSAGSAVLLAATEHLPPGSVERVVLLAPAVASDYDLRPALACSRQGVDAFVSQRDRLYLGVGTAMLGTTDGRRAEAAGRVGFHPRPTAPADAALFAKLREHPWEPCVAWTGHHGEHPGSYRPGYFSAYVLPLLAP